MPIFVHVDQMILNWSILLIAAIVLVNHLDNHFLNLTQAQQRFDIFNTKTLLVGTANTLISAGIATVYPSIALLYAAQLLLHLLTITLMIRHSRRTFTGKDFSPEYDRQTGRELLSFGFKNFIGTLAGQVESQFSNLILGAMASAGAITAFNVPQSIVTKGAGIVSQFAQTFFPLSASLLVKDRIKKLRTLFFGMEGLALLGGALAVILTFTIGESFLLWWLRDPIVAYTAYPVLRILSFYFLLVILTPIPTALLQGLDKPHIPSFFAVLTVILEIIFALAFIPRFGVLGVAYAFLLSVVISIPPFLISAFYMLSKKIAEYE